MTVTCSRARPVVLSVIFVLAACGGGGGGSSALPPSSTTAPSPPPPQPEVVATSPYVAGAEHADDLRPCTYDGSATRSCTLDTLPFLGMETHDPQIADILERTLVSHTWMGDNLAAVLAELPPDVLPLFRSITAVVIASDVRPAHYDSATGAIYLDPEFLWLTTAQRDVVSDDPDPRSNFGASLDFHMPWRYVRNNQRLTVYLNADGSRDLAQIVEIMGYLLYHELAHAVDFLPPARLAGLSSSQTAENATRSTAPLSSGFVSVYPLTSTLLKELADVSFFGETATPEQQSLQPEDLVDEFADDGATQYYAYATQYEDFASLFETAMMKWHFGYDKDTGIAHKPATGDTDDSVLAWGVRGRIGTQHVRTRALDVGQRMYPGDLAAFEAFLLSEPPPQYMPPGTTWGDNLVLDAQAAPQGQTATGIARDGRTPDHFLERVHIR